MSIYIFAGPTLGVDEARPLLEAIYLPPVSQGDVYRVGLLRPDAIGIIDGYFDRVPAVWHKEILWAMAQGISVYGSASMGALRAAELAPFGMEGVGEIFEAYRDGALEDDDEVAVAHGAADTGYRRVSVAMVNIRKTLAEAESSGIISRTTRQKLECVAKELFYPERSYKSMLGIAAGRGLASAELFDLERWLPRFQIDQKRNDAISMLRHMNEQIGSKPEPKRPDYKLEHTVFWERLMLQAGGGEAPVANQSTMVTSDEILDELRLRGVGYLNAREQGLLRDLAIREAQHKGYRADRELADKKVAALRADHGLQTAQEFRQWLDENALNEQSFQNLIEEETVIARVLDEQDPSRRRMQDHLRVSGAYRQLRNRALDKRCILDEAGWENPTLEKAGVSTDELLRWYFRRHGPFLPPDPKHYTRVLGFEHVETFLLAILREFCYVRLKEGPGGDELRSSEAMA
jgi:hypothetical protein